MAGDEFRGDGGAESGAGGTVNGEAVSGRLGIALPFLLFFPALAVLDRLWRKACLARLPRTRLDGIEVRASRWLLVGFV